MNQVVYHFDKRIIKDIFETFYDKKGNGKIQNKNVVLVSVK